MARIHRFSLLGRRLHQPQGSKHPDTECVEGRHVRTQKSISLRQRIPQHHSEAKDGPGSSPYRCWEAQGICNSEEDEARLRLCTGSCRDRMYSFCTVISMKLICLQAGGTIELLPHQSQEACASNCCIAFRTPERLLWQGSRPYQGSQVYFSNRRQGLSSILTSLSSFLWFSSTTQGKVLGDQPFCDDATIDTIRLSFFDGEDSFGSQCRDDFVSVLEENNEPELPVAMVCLIATMVGSGCDTVSNSVYWLHNILHRFMRYWRIGVVATRLQMRKSNRSMRLPTSAFTRLTKQLSTASLMVVWRSTMR